MFGKVAVVFALAVGRIADDRMRDVLQVPADLMFAAGERFKFEQGITAGRVAVDGDRQFDGRQPTITGLC